MADIQVFYCCSLYSTLIYKYFVSTKDFIKTILKKKRKQTKLNTLERQKWWVCKQAKKLPNRCKTPVKDRKFCKHLEGYWTWITSQEKRMFQETSGKEPWCCWEVKLNETEKSIGLIDTTVIDHFSFSDELRAIS